MSNTRERSITVMNRGDHSETVFRGGKDSELLASQLELRRKGGPEKVQIPHRLRAETTMTLDWIARSLNMGALANLLRQNQQ